MKYPNLLFTLFFISSCSPQPKPVVVSTLVEDYVKSQMKDPSSFQLIQTQVADTTMMSKFLLGRFNEDTSMISKTMYSTEIITITQDTNESVQERFNKKINFYKHAAKKDSMELADLKIDRIFYISYVVDNRAKNGFIALDKATSLVNFYPADTTFKITTP